MKPATVFELESVEATAKLAARVAAGLKNGAIIGLSGPLGAGKTEFVRGLVAALGGDAKTVCSPSYVLEAEYALPDGRTVHHWDLYRLRDDKEVLQSLCDLKNAGRDIVCVEWFERISGVKDLLLLEISLEFATADEARICRIVNGNGATTNFQI